MCITGLVLIDNACLLALKTAGIGYLFALALGLTVIAAKFLSWAKIEPLLSPYRNEMRVAEGLLNSHYSDDPKAKLPVGEVQGMWQAIGYGTLARHILIAAIVIPLLLIAR